MKKTRKFICLALASLLLLANLLTVAPVATENTSTAVVDPKYIVDFSADSYFQEGSALKMADPTNCSVEYGIVGTFNNDMPNRVLYQASKAYYKNLTNIYHWWIDAYVLVSKESE